MKRYTEDISRCEDCRHGTNWSKATYCRRLDRDVPRDAIAPDCPLDDCPLPAAPEENAIPKTECRINQWKGTQKP